MMEILRISSIFNSDNHEHKVNSGKNGLEPVVKNNYDLILLDMNMPNCSGMQFLRDLKNKKPLVEKSCSC